MRQTPTPEVERPLLSPREVSTLAGVSLKTVYRQIDTGALPALRAGHQLRIDRGDFSRWLGR
jgi:excisionase family DNA binding protein